MIKPSSQTDPSGNGINFGDDVTRFGQNQIWSDDKRDVVAELLLARELNQLGGLPGIEIRSDPCGLFAIDAALVELVARSLENEKAMTKLLEFFFKSTLDRKRLRGEQEVLLGEQAFLGEGGSNRGKFGRIGVHLRGMLNC